jgi:hypothetical protein
MSPCFHLQLCSHSIHMNVSSDSHCLWQALCAGWHRPGGIGGKDDRMQRVGSLQVVLSPPSMVFLSTTSV